MSAPKIEVPRWLIKPSHPERLVATDKGWEVEKTGEVLVAVKDLDKRIAAYAEEVKRVSKILRDATRKKPGPKKAKE